MSSQVLDLMETEPLNDPVTQAGSPQIVKSPCTNTRSVPDLIEVMAELRYRRPAFLNIPLSNLTILLDAVIPSHRDKNVWAAFRLGHLMLNQKSDQFGSQRKCTPFGVLNVPLPRIRTILLW